MPIVVQGRHDGRSRLWRLARLDPTRAFSTPLNGVVRETQLKGVLNIQFMQMLKHPRWEDYDYSYLHAASPFAYMGNGYTLSDVDPNADKAPYLDTAGIPVVGKIVGFS